MTVADKLTQEVPDDVVSSLNVTYFPQLAFLIAAEMVEPWNQDTQDEQVLEGWTFQFASEYVFPLHFPCTPATDLTVRSTLHSDIVYFKDPKMHDLDAHFGDLHSKIVDREIEIAHKLSETVLEQTEVLQDAASMCDELDWSVTRVPCPNIHRKLTCPLTVIPA
jgi:DNA mismatch repair protein MSH5